MSGAGKSTAIKMMEDIGYYCVDNLPIALLEKFVELSSLQETAELQKVAVGIDIRNGQALEEMRDVLARIKKKKVHYEILFLDAEDSVLVKRYKETRRNREFEQVSLEEQLFYRYFRPAKEKEDGEWLSPAEILEDIKKNSAIPLSNKRVSVFGRVLRKHEIPSKRVHRGTVYHVVRVL